MQARWRVGMEQMPDSDSKRQKAAPQEADDRRVGDLDNTDELDNGSVEGTGGRSQSVAGVSRLLLFILLIPAITIAALLVLELLSLVLTGEGLLPRWLWRLINFIGQLPRYLGRLL